MRSNYPFRFIYDYLVVYESMSSHKENTSCDSRAYFLYEIICVFFFCT